MSAQPVRGPIGKLATMRAPPTYRSTGLPRRFDVAKSIVRAWLRVTDTSNAVGIAASRPASDPAAPSAGSRFTWLSRSRTQLEARRRVLRAHRHEHARRREVVAGLLALVGAQVDRHRHAQLVAGMSHAVVVRTERARHRGHEHVVHAAAQSRRGLLHRVERHLERLEPAAQRARSQQIPSATARSRAPAAGPTPPARPRRRHPWRLRRGGSAGDRRFRGRCRAAPNPLRTLNVSASLSTSSGVVRLIGSASSRAAASAATCSLSVGAGSSAGAGRARSRPGSTTA